MPPQTRPHVHLTLELGPPWLRASALTSGRRESCHITVQTQHSHSSSPQSQPKQGLETDLMGFLTVPELVEGRMQLVGASAEAIIVSEWTTTNWNDQQIAQPYH